MSNIQLYDDGHFIKSKISWITDCEAELMTSEITIEGFPLNIGEKLNVKNFKFEVIL